MTARAVSPSVLSQDTKHQTLGLLWAYLVVGGLHLHCPWPLPSHVHMFWSQPSVYQLDSPQQEAAVGMGSGIPRGAELGRAPPS